MRDRLIKLLRNAPKTDVVYGNVKLAAPAQTLQTIADHLLANGVVIIDPQKYPPVTNRGIIETIMGVPLDEMAELIRAKQEGRIIVPPVKVGDVIFATPINERNIYEFEVATITIETKNSPIKYSYVCYGGWRFDDRHWGKTVFLTREEAEKTLKGGAE